MDDRVDAALQDRDVITQSTGERGFSTASASSRSAVTGVRSRWERSATTARSAASSSRIRSARPLSARASSLVSSVPRTRARAARSPPRSPWAMPATSRSGSARRRPCHAAVAPASASSSTPSPTMPSHALGHACVQVVRRDARAHDRRALLGHHRQQHPSAGVVHHLERLAVEGALHLRVVGVDLAGARALRR